MPLVATAALQAAVAFTVVGDGIPQPLTAQPGDAVRGRAIVASRQQGLCLLCHQAPIPEERFQGNLATNLAGAGSRWTPAQLRLRLVDSGRLNPDSLITLTGAKIEPSVAGAQGLDKYQFERQGFFCVDSEDSKDLSQSRRSNLSVLENQEDTSGEISLYHSGVMKRDQSYDDRRVQTGRVRL